MEGLFSFQNKVGFTKILSNINTSTQLLSCLYVPFFISLSLAVILRTHVVHLISVLLCFVFPRTHIFNDNFCYTFHLVFQQQIVILMTIYLPFWGRCFIVF